MKKRIFSFLLALVMVLGMVPLDTNAAAAELSVSGNVIDINDVTQGSWQIKTMTVSGATVVSATQDGTTIDVVLAGDTSESASISLSFSGSSMINPQNTTGSLSGGKGTIKPSVLFMNAGRPQGGVNYTVNFSLAPAGEEVSVTPPSGEGFSFEGKETAYKDGTYSFTLTVKEGYDGANMAVKVNGEKIDGNNGVYQVKNVPGDLVITVEGIEKKVVCNITAPTGEGFAFAGNATAYKGEAYTFTLTVEDGWDGSNMVVKAGEEVLTGKNGSYTIDAVSEDTVITVEGLKKKTVYSITAPTGEGFVFTGDPTVYEGENYTFTVTVDEAWDGSNMVVKAGEEVLTGKNGSYTISAVGEDTVITVSGLTKKPVYSVTKPTGNGFAFTGDETVISGKDYTFTLTAKGLYDLSEAVVKVNGNVVSGTNGTYTVTGVQEDLVITVENVKQAQLPDKEISVSDGVVDITDKEIHKLSSSIKATATKITVSGVTVEAAYEDGTTVYLLLPADTDDGAAVSATVGVDKYRSYTVTGDTGSTALTDGSATMTLEVTAQYSSSRKGTVTYTLVFLRKEVDPEPPTRLTETDSQEVYKTNTLALNLEDYFENAVRYYLVEGEKMTLLDGKIYEFYSAEACVKELVFAAENDYGMCPDRVTVTVTVKEITGGVWIGHTTSSGSLDFVIFKDAQGNVIEGVEAVYADKQITVTLPKSYPITGKVIAQFSLTQNASGYPFLSTKTATSGTSGDKAVTNKFTEKTITLSAGAGALTFYYFNSAPTGSNQETFKLTYKVANDLPDLAEGVSATGEAAMEAGQQYTLDLAPVFADADGDSLTYKVSINGEAAVAADADYSFTTDVAGVYTLVFTANDGKDTSTATYTVTLTVENVKQTDSMTVSVPQDLTPSFWIATGFEDGIDRQGAAVDAVKGETAEGMTAYTVSYPINASMLSVRAEGWGGMAFPVEKDGAVSLRKVQMTVVDYTNAATASTNTASYGENTAAAGENGWLLVSGTEYVFTAVPGDATLATMTKTETLASGEGAYTVAMKLGLKNPLSITVPTGATVNVYKYNQYYSNTDIDAKIITDNGNGTTTFQFIADTTAHGAAYIYRVAMEGKITKSGWLAWNQQNLTVTYTDDDKSPDYRLDDYSATGAENSGVAEDSVLLNINSRNHLSLDVGQTKTLKAYRVWEIIPKSFNNYIITPDFTYTILSGDDVVKLTPKDSNSAGEGDWMTLTALKEGVAVIEVTYDAIDVSSTGDSDYDGVYGASDPARSGLVVVQVGGSNDASVKFGIDGFTSIGSSGSKNITYNPNNKKEWDAEFDTLYFTGNSGELNFSPTASSTITEVAVSNDKGATWNVLTGASGVYTARILPGNNILRVTTASGTAYQIVRGDKIKVKLTEVSGKSDGDGIVEAGETIRVSLVGLHNPIPKMAGNYNPGYGGNTDGYSSQHLNYTCNGTAIYGIGMQYNFITAANYVDVVMPEDGSPVTLTDGYIGLGVVGLTQFFNGGDSHRNIPDGGCTTRGNQTTYHTRSILPEITVTSGSETDPNSAPIVRNDAVTEGSIYADQKFAINPDTLFMDPDGNAMTFTVSVNGEEAEDAPVTYKFTPSGVGTYTLVFTATDGKLSASHTVTVTVTERPQVEEPKDDFGLEESEIAGYVTISIVDNGIRVEGETGLKFPEPLGDIIAPIEVPFKQGERITHVTQRLLEHFGMRMSYSGTLDKDFYMGAIYNFEVDGVPYDSMGEFDAGTGSGWMITQNDVFINMGASEFEVKDGDIIQWKYTCQLGADIGDTYYVEIKEVMDLIDAIGTVTKESGDAITSARTAYDELDESQKKKVTNYDALTAAEKAYAQLVKTAADEKAAKAVEEKIAAIGTVTLSSGEKIRQARAAYDALTATQKALVKNLSVLEAAEETLEVLKKPAPANNFKEIYSATGDYLESLVEGHGLTVNAIGGEWIAVGLARAGREMPNKDAYYKEVVKFVRENINENQQLHRAKSTENSRIILALTALGYDVTDVDGHDLLMGLNDMTYLNKQGINGPIWALIAFDSGSYEIPAGGDVTREKLIRAILEKQLADGGWTLSGTVADTDMTGMALTALAPYYAADAKVKAAVDKALELLSRLQNADGGFNSVDGANAESAAQVVVALTALGIDPHTDSRFVKNGRSVVDALCDYYVEGSGFKHVASMDVNGMATEQSYYALAAYFRFLEGKTALFDMGDVNVQEENPEIPEETVPEETVPEETVPEETVPEETVPEETVPEETEPEETEPEETEPEETEPEETEPEETVPEETVPVETEPKPTEPTPTEPEPTVPEDTEPVTPEKPVTRVEVKDGGFTHVPEKLKEVGLDTVEKVKEAIIQAMVKQNQHIEEENVAHYDVQLQYTEDGGKTWIKADESHFPKDGKLTVTIPYPAGTDSSYTFTVVHMFTSSAFGKTPGDVELPEVTNTEEGIQFEVTGLSPISVGWVAPVSADALQNEDTPDVTTYFIIMLAAVVCLVVVMIASHKRKRASK